MELASFDLPERFRPELVLGEGAYGIVYKCWDQKLRRHVAIKKARHQAIDQNIFLREARVASQLKHPGIVQIFDVGELNDQAFIVSEYIEGTTLKFWLTQNHVSLDKSCEICEAIAQALSEAHDKGIIHRDIKPGNILMDPQGRPKLVDFGLSHSRNSGFDTLLVEGSPIGTPAYMAPEQVEGRATSINKWSDVYAVGVILYQMLAGRMPFTGTTQQMMEAILSSSALPPSHYNPKVPAALDAICMKALAKPITERFQTAREFADSLSRYSAGLPLDVYPRLYPQRVKRLTKTIAVPSFLALAVIVVVLNFIYGPEPAGIPQLEVMIESNPPGAELVWYPLDFEKGEFVDQPVHSKAGEIVKLPSGFYRVQATTGDECFEVFRAIPTKPENAMTIQYQFNGAAIVCPHRWSINENNVVQLKPIVVVPETKAGRAMAWFGNGECSFPQSESLMESLSGKTFSVGSFLMDTDEVTWAEMQKTFPDLQLPKDQLPGDAARNIPLDVALAFCEFNGKNLPTIYELRFVATNSGTTLFPWGNEDDNFVTRAASDASLSNPPVKNLLAGVGEWTESIFFVHKASSGKSDSLPARNGPMGMMIPFPESWLSISGDGKRWFDSVPGIEYSTPGTLNPDRGFRAVRRLNNRKK
jgi:serine/threonine protein kinase